MNSIKYLTIFLLVFFNMSFTMESFKKRDTKEIRWAKKDISDKMACFKHTSTQFINSNGATSSGTSLVHLHALDPYFDQIKHDEASTPQ